MGRPRMPRGWLVACLVAGAAAVAPSRAWAYSTDVHFNLTYVQARLAGLDRLDALWVALGDESIDHNRSTSAYSGTIDTLFQFLGVHRYIWARNGERWQAYTDVGAVNSPLNGVLTAAHYADPAAARAAVYRRRDDVWNTALAALGQIQPNDRATMIRADIALGQFLHVEQDLYGHRQFGAALDGENWVPYGAFRGHSSEGYSPDYVALRPELARQMLASSYAYIQQWQGRRGFKAPSLTAGFTATLIEHVGAAYDPRALQYPAHRFRPWYPGQRELNQELSSALSGFAFAREWSSSLPNANDLKLQLPYDQPHTPLRAIERRVGEPVLSAPNVPFSAVLTKDFLRP